MIGSGNVPPSANLPFAETASPEERGDGPHWTDPWKAPAPANPAPFQGVAAPVSGHVPGATPSTGAMPGVPQDPEMLPDDVPRILAGFLVSYDNEPLGRFWPIYQGRNRIGRKGSGFELDIELEHPTASSRHAVLLASATPGRMKLEDTGSTNGTLVNGVRLAPGVRVELADGAHVRFGLLSTLVKIV